MMRIKLRRRSDRGRKAVRRLAVLCGAALFAAVSAAGMTSGPVHAADEDYTYTVRLYSGEHSTLKNGGEVLVRTDVAYGSPLPFSIGDVVQLDENDKYYVRGIRESGRDNNTTPLTDAELKQAYTVTEDRDYVVAYGVRGDHTVAYTVRYEDTAGNELAPAQTYYGNIGDRPVVAFLYIEGYIPQAYNLTRTLTGNPEENVLTFRYTRMSPQAQAAADEVISAGTTGGGTGTAGTTTTGTGTTGTTTTGTGTGTGTTAGTGTGTTAGTQAGAEGPAGGEAEAAVEAAAAEDGQDVENLVSLDDGEVPLADGESSGISDADGGGEMTNLSDTGTPLSSVDFATLLWDVPPAAKAGIFSTQILVVLAVAYVVLRKKGKIPSYVDKVLEAFGHPESGKKGKAKDAE